MKGINFGRILLGGVLGGLLILGKDFILHHNCLLQYWHSAIAAGHFHAAQPWFRGIFLVESLLEGILLAWLYVLARGRLGPGPRTAVIAGLTGGLLVRGVTAIDYLMWIPVPQVFSVSVFIVGVTTSVLATLLAGWVYQEK